MARFSIAISSPFLADLVGRGRICGPNSEEPPEFGRTAASAGWDETVFAARGARARCAVLWCGVVRRAALGEPTECTGRKLPTACALWPFGHAGRERRREAGELVRHARSSSAATACAPWLARSAVARAGEEHARTEKILESSAGHCPRAHPLARSAVARAGEEHAPRVRTYSECCAQAVF